MQRRRMINWMVIRNSLKSQPYRRMAIPHRPGRRGGIGIRTMLIRTTPQPVRCFFVWKSRKWGVTQCSAIWLVPMTNYLTKCKRLLVSYILFTTSTRFRVRRIGPQPTLQSIIASTHQLRIQAFVCITKAEKGHCLSANVPHTLTE